MINHLVLRQEVSALYKLIYPLKKYKREFWMVFYASTIINFLMLAPMIYLLQIFDRIMISQSIASLTSITLLLAFMYLIMHVSEKIRGAVVIALGLKLDELYSDKLYFQALRKNLDNPLDDPFRYHDDFTNFRQWFTGPAIYSFFDLPWAPIYLYIMFLLHPYLGFLALFLMTLAIVLAFIVQRGLGEMPEELAEEEKNINKFTYQHLRLGEVVSIYNLARNFKKKWLDIRLSVLKLTSKYDEKTQIIQAVNKNLRVFFASSALGLAAYLVIQEQLTLGAMIAASMLMSRCLAPIDSIAGSYAQLLLVRKGIVRLAELLTKENLTENLNHNLNFESIRIVGVTVYAQKMNQKIIDNVDLVINSKKITAIVGPSGSGKTTLLKLIVGLQNIDKGQVKFGDIEVQDNFMDHFHSRIGFMSQKSNIFAGTVGRNIARMGIPDPKEVVRVSRFAGTHDFILRLPQGYDTEINEDSKLSGGQVQRIAFARALYGDPKILILDEPNSNLDVIGELRLKEVLKTLREKEYTIVFVSHRKDLLEVADNIIELDNGSIKFSGNIKEFEELRKNNRF